MGCKAPISKTTILAFWGHGVEELYEQQEEELGEEDENLGEEPLRVELPDHSHEQTTSGETLGEQALRSATEALKVNHEIARQVRRMQRTVNFMCKRDHLYHTSIGF